MSDEQQAAIDNAEREAGIERARTAFRSLDAELSAGGRSRDEAGWSGAMYGFAPVQAEGTVDGLPWYFRARHDSWSFAISSAADGNPVRLHLDHAGGYYHEEDYGADHAASWMPYAEAWVFIAREIARFRGVGFNYTPDPAAGSPR